MAPAPCTQFHLGPPTTRPRGPASPAAGGAPRPPAGTRASSLGVALSLAVTGRAQDVEDRQAEGPGYPGECLDVGVVLAALYAGDRHERDAGPLGELGLAELPPLPEFPDTRLRLWHARLPRPQT